METLLPDTKKCRGACGEVKPLESFGVQKDGKFGRKPRCKVCLNDENSKYYQSNKEQALEASKTRYYANVEYERERSRQKYSANKEAHNALTRSWYENNKDRAKELHAEWKRNNKDKVRDYDNRRRALEAGTSVGPIDTEALWEASQGVCGLCSEPLFEGPVFPDPLSPSLDHIVPLSKGGTHTQDNIQLAHLGCNVRKGNRVNK